MMIILLSSPTINARDGSLSLAWAQKLGENQSVKTTVHPNRRDLAWTANVNFPMDSTINVYNVQRYILNVISSFNHTTCIYNVV